ncbi:MAG: M48 family metalloprotease [Burkholderiales bacterium]
MSAVVAAPEGSGSLVYPNERRLFAITLAISVVVWLVILVGTFGIALIYVLLAFLFYLFVQSAFISYLRGHAAQITAGQFADLHDRIRGACMKLGVDPMPDAFLLHGNGAFNAFATRFPGRNFIVLLSDVVDALESEPGAIDFYIGHELGHIRRKHLPWGPVLAEDFHIDVRSCPGLASELSLSPPAAAVARRGARLNIASNPDVVPLSDARSRIDALDNEIIESARARRSRSHP